MSQPTKEQFLENVKTHELKIIKDDGVYRHIKMLGYTGAMWYEIITWPNKLCFSGDMGTFVFNRREDMFEFFRRDKLVINTGYWHEKLEAVDRVDGSKKWSRNVFEANIKEYFDAYCEGVGLLLVQQNNLWAAIKDQVINCDDNAVRSFDAANDFEYKGFTFSDYWETDNTEYTFRFIWCLYAIVYAIMEYDKKKAE